MEFNCYRIIICVKNSAVSPSKISVRNVFENLRSILVDSSTVIWWTNLFDILGVSDLFCSFYYFLMEDIL